MLGKTKHNTKVVAATKKRLPRSIRLFGWTLIATGTIIFGLPLIYEIYLHFTPNLDPHLEQRTQVIAEQSAIIFGIAIFILGSLLALKRWRWERKRVRLKALVRDYRLRKHRDNLKSKM